MIIILNTGIEITQNAEYTTSHGIRHLNLELTHIKVDNIKKKIAMKKYTMIMVDINVFLIIQFGYYTTENL